MNERHRGERTTTRDAASGRERFGTESIVERVPAGDRTTHRREDEPIADTALFHEEDLRAYRARWDAIQTGFVDRPREAVQQADALVEEIIKRLVDTFGSERRTIERQWEGIEQVSTEDLRIALTRYRSFFERLLSV